MTNFKDFIESKELEEIVGSDKYQKYKYKFSKVVEKAGVGELDISDEVAINKLGMGSWNWFGILLLVWSLYLNITSGRNNHWYFGNLIAIYLFDFAH